MNSKLNGWIQQFDCTFEMLNWKTLVVFEHWNHLIYIKILHVLAHLNFGDFTKRITFTNDIHYHYICERLFKKNISFTCCLKRLVHKHIHGSSKPFSFFCVNSKEPF
jgi:hypothetical protein